MLPNGFSCSWVHNQHLLRPHKVHRNNVNTSGTPDSIKERSAAVPTLLSEGLKSFSVTKKLLGAV